MHYECWFHSCEGLVKVEHYLFVSKPHPLVSPKLDSSDVGPNRPLTSTSQYKEAEASEGLLYYRASSHTYSGELSGYIFERNRNLRSNEEPLGRTNFLVLRNVMAHIFVTPLHETSVLGGIEK